MNIYTDLIAGSILTGVDAEWRVKEDNLPNRLVVSCFPRQTGGIGYRYAANPDDNEFRVKIWSGFFSADLLLKAEGPEEREALFDAYIVQDDTQKSQGSFRLLFLRNVVEILDEPAGSSSSSNG